MYSWYCKDFGVFNDMVVSKDLNDMAAGQFSNIATIMSTSANLHVFLVLHRFCVFYELVAGFKHLNHFEHMCESSRILGRESIFKR